MDERRGGKDGNIVETNKETLSGIEQESVLKAVVDMVREYPDLNDIEVGFESLNKDGASIGIYGIQGAVVERRFINGAFIGTVPFGIIYRSQPRTDTQRLGKLEFLNNLAKWLSEIKEYPQLADKIIQEIRWEQVPFKDNSRSAGDNDYVVTMKVAYKKLKE